MNCTWSFFISVRCRRRWPGLGD